MQVILECSDDSTSSIQKDFMVMLFEGHFHRIVKLVIKLLKLVIVSRRMVSTKYVELLFIHTLGIGVSRKFTFSSDKTNASIQKHYCSEPEYDFVQKMKL